MAEPLYPEALPTLTHLHWYVLERVLGQGGFGITYLAKDTNLDQRVAIKEYLPVEFATRLPDSTVRSRTEQLRDRYRWGLERFIQEARTLARFDHPNIVRVLSVFEFNNTAYIVMRFEEGGTLAAMLDRRGTVPEAELLRILVQVLDGLELVHNAGFIHRDIKPDNIHIGGDGRPVLLDFGSARQAVGSSNTLTILIAPGYAPFEQYYNDPSSQGPWTDIYGLGATAYRAICGRAPLDAVSRSKGILGSTQEIMVPATVVGAGRYSGRFLAAIDHALAFAEKDRPQTIAEWRRELAGENAPPVVATAAMPPRGPSHGRTGASQPTVLAEAATVVPGAAMPLAQGGSSPSHSAVEPVLRTGYAPPWAWVLVIIAVAVAAVAVYTAMALRGALENEKVATNGERTQKQQPDERQPKPPEQAPPEEKKQQPATPPIGEPGVSAQPKRRDEPSSKPSPKPAPPVPSQKEARPPSMATSQREAKPTVPVSLPVSLPAAPPTEAPSNLSPPAVPPEKETLPPASPLAKDTMPPSGSETPAPRTPAERLADADKAFAEGRNADAIKQLEPLANAGNASAQTRLGDAYAEGRGVERDATVARRWYERAANAGNVAAMLKLVPIFVDEKAPNFAYIWCRTAEQLGAGAAAKDQCERVARQLQPKEIQQGDRVVASKVEQMKKGKEQ